VQRDPQELWNLPLVLLRQGSLPTMRKLAARVSPVGQACWRSLWAMVQQLLQQQVQQPWVQRQQPQQLVQQLALPLGLERSSLEAPLPEERLAQRSLLPMVLVWQLGQLRVAWLQERGAQRWQLELASTHQVHHLLAREQEQERPQQQQQLVQPWVQLLALGLGQGQLQVWLH